MHYLLMYDVVDNYVTARIPFRKAHLLHATAAYERGEMDAFDAEDVLAEARRIAP